MFVLTLKLSFVLLLISVSSLVNAQTSPTPGQVVISEFVTRGAAGAGAEGVEIQNISNVALDISGCRLRGSSASGVVTDRLVISTPTILQPGQHFLITPLGNATQISGRYYHIGPC